MTIAEMKTTLDAALKRANERITSMAGVEPYGEDKLRERETDWETALKLVDGMSELEPRNGSPELLQCFEVASKCLTAIIGERWAYAWACGLREDKARTLTLVKRCQAVAETHTLRSVVWKSRQWPPQRGQKWTPQDLQWLMESVSQVEEEKCALSAVFKEAAELVTTRTECGGEIAEMLTVAARVYGQLLAGEASFQALMAEAEPYRRAS